MGVVLSTRVPECEGPGASGLVARWRRANTGVSPLRCAPVEMTRLERAKKSSGCSGVCGFGVEEADG